MSEHVSNYWWSENRSYWLYPRNLFTVAPRSPAWPHFPYIMMAIERGNSTGAMDGLPPPFYKKGQCIGLCNNYV